MDGVIDSGVTDELLMVAARALTGRGRRVFQGRVCLALCEFTEPGTVEPPASPRGRLRSEEKNPQLAMDIRVIVEPHTQSDPELKTARRYTNLSAAEVRESLQAKGYDESQLPSERTIRDILNRMNYRLKRIQKGKPLKKTKDTDAIFDNVKAAREKYAGDPETLEISCDTKTKVSLGEYSMGGKNTDRQRRKRPASPRS